jgi:acetyl-CoA carboxylase biotin carboxyl carrier protein
MWKGHDMAQAQSDLETIKEIIAIMKDNDLIEVNIEHGEDKLRLRRAEPAPAPTLTALPLVGTDAGAGAQAPLAPASSPAQAEDAAQDDGLTEITSPLVGTFYEAPSPDSGAYVEIGTHVDPQSVVCIVEAMKVLNEIKAEVRGTIVEVLVNNGQAIEFGQPLFKVKPD